MGVLFDKIKQAASDGNYLVTWHADERCEERAITDWQLVAGLAQAQLIEERPTTRPTPSIVVRQTLADGTTVEVIWGWLEKSRRAKLITAYFPGDR